MSVNTSPYIMAERIDFGYRVPELIDESGHFDPTKVNILQEILAENSYRRDDEIVLRDWHRGIGAPINTRVLKKGNIEVTNKVNNKVQHNYLKRLTRIRTGYLGGNPVKYTLNGDYYKKDGDIDKAFMAMNDFIKQSNISDIHSETISDCTLYGQSGRLLYLDKAPFGATDKPVVLAMHVPGYDCIFLAQHIWWMPEISIRYVSDEDKIEVYDKTFIHTFVGGTYESSVEHKVKFNPLIPYYNNSDRLGNIEDCLSKINDIDEQRSNLSSLLTTQRLVLKIFKDVDIDTDTVEKTEQMGYIKLKTNENGQGQVYLEELHIDSGATEKHIEELDRAVYLDAGIVNIDDKQFGSESGAAKKFYMIPMESNCIDTESKFRASDYMMWGIVSSFYTTINIPLIADSIIADWARNLPYDAREDVEIVSLLWGKVPKRTLYQLLPFIADPDATAEEFEMEYSGTQEASDEQKAEIMNVQK